MYTQSHKYNYTTEHSKQKKDKLDERKYYTSIYIQIVKKIKHIITHSHTYTHPDIYTTGNSSVYVRNENQGEYTIAYTM